MGTVGSVETVHETDGATVNGEHTSSAVCEGGERKGARAGAEAAQQADRSRDDQAVELVQTDRIIQQKKGK